MSTESAQLAHFEIAGPNDATLVGFYGRLLGWTVDPRGPGYTLLPPAAGPGGAVIEADRPNVTLGVTVANLEAIVDQVAALGGEILMPPTDNGWVTRLSSATPPTTSCPSSRPARRRP